MTFRDALAERSAILDRLSTDGVDLGLQPPSAPVKQIIGRLLKLDDFIPWLLKKDGADPDKVIQESLDEMTQEYKEEQAESARIQYRLQLERFYRHHPDPDDRPDPPPHLPGVTGLRDQIEIRYRMLCKLSLEQQQRGAWPFVVGDLLDDVGVSDVLLIECSRDILERHPDTPQIVAVSSDESVIRLARSYRDTVAALKARQQREIQMGISPKAVIDTIGKVIDWAVRAEVVYNIAEKVFKTVKAEAERLKAILDKERFIRDLEGRGGRLEGADKFIDRFDRNRDVISRTC